MNLSDQDRLQRLLRAALPPIVDDPVPSRSLWPAMLQRVQSEPRAVPWFDWALAGGLAVFLAAFPATIPMLLYYLLPADVVRRKKGLCIPILTCADSLPVCSFRH